MDASNLKSYINKLTRHKLLFLEPEVVDLQYIDIGKELSLRLTDSLDSKVLSMIAEDALNEILDSHTMIHPDLGEYVAIKNIGILFEQDLKLNLHSLFERYARSKVCIVKLEGVVVKDTFYLGKSNQSSFSISLKDLGHQVIYENI